jgi:glycosyltransferase involved in cell wall biosynthesis
MQVVWLSHRDAFHPHAGGAEQTQHEVLRRLASAEVAPIVISSRFRGSAATQVSEGVTYLRYPPEVLHLAAAKAVRAASPKDAVIADLAHVIPWPSIRRATCRCVAFFRHLHSRTLFGQLNPAAAFALAGLERAYPLIFGREAEYVTESLTGRNDLLELGISAQNVTIIRPGVDSELFQPTSRVETPRMIHFGGLRAYKRPDHAIAVLKAIRSRGTQVDLVVTGEGHLLSRLKDLSARLQTEVSFVGRLSRGQLAKVVAQSWLHLACSTAEGWGLTSWESAAAGVPTAAYDVPGLNESVIDGVTGKLARAGDIEALTEKSLLLLEVDQQWRERCRAAVAEFTWARSAGQWRELLDIG